MVIRTAIYARISDDAEGLELGVKRQVDDCTEDADRSGETVVAVFIDNDRGASTHSKKPRPDYDRMIAMAKAGDLDVMRSYSNSRFTRRPMEVEGLIRLHEATGVRLRTRVSGDDDLSTADGRMVARIKAAVDAAEAERTSERVRRESLARAEAGEEHGGQRPYGWCASDRSKLDPDEYAVLLEAKTRVMAGESRRSIVKDFNARWIPTASGPPRPPLAWPQWSVSSLKSVLIKPRNAGIRLHQGKPIGKGTWQPAWSELEHRQLCRLLDKADRQGKSSNARKYLHTGLAICADCRVTAVLRINSEKGRDPRRFYGCPVCGRIRKMDWVDTYTDGVMTEFLKGYKPRPVEPVDPDAEAEVERLRQRIDDTRAQFAESDDMSPAELADTLRALRARLKKAEDRATPPPAGSLLDGVTGENPARPWESLDLEQKRRIIDMFFTVELHRGRPGIRVFDPATVQFVPK